MSDWNSIVRRSVVDVGAYVPGVSAAEVKARLGRDDLVRLNWNENPLGPLPGVIEEVAGYLGESWIYPEERYEEFRAAVAQWIGAEPAEVVPGHGIQGLTLSLVKAFIDPGDAVVIPLPTYGLYAKVCATAGASVVRVRNRESLALDLDGIAAAAHEHRAKLVWICDPNNPTGMRLGQEEWSTFLAALPDGCVAIADEAYADYIEPGARIDRLADIRAGAPVVVVRTFSKIFGLAGLRLGYALMHSSLAPYVHAVQEPFNVNLAALAAGLASLRRIDLLPERRAQALQARARLTDPLTAAGLTCVASDAPFVLVRLDADDVAIGEALARQGLLVRPGSEFGLPGYTRITLADEELMDTVAQKLTEALTVHA
jgi:histidinol-phosphate aminotransferase